MNNNLHIMLRPRSKGRQQIPVESPMEPSAKQQLSPRGNQQILRIKRVRNSGVKTLASIVVLGLLSVGLDWYIDGIKERNNVSVVLKAISSSQTQQNQDEHKESTYTKPVERIVLIGERHSGTNWITGHLTECFQGEHLKVDNHYSAWKHWFQEDDVERVPENSAVVVAMFRDPYTWVEAMRVQPHHAHNHINLTQFANNKQKGKGWRKRGGKPLGWKEFVTKPWVGETERDDIFGLSHNLYEMQADGSGKAYSSIIDLRRDKIINHLSVANFVGTRTFLPMRYEDLNANGTSVLLRSIEEATGQRANCSAVIGKGPIVGKGRRRLQKKRKKKKKMKKEDNQITKHSELSDEFIDWMNKFVDWEVESQIGYYKRVPKPSVESLPPSDKQREWSAKDIKVYPMLTQKTFHL